jgi:death on curing protein
MAEYYESADLAKQAALLILGIAQAHPFVDGNKRVALAAGDVMIQLNGYMVDSESEEFGKQIVAAIIGSDKGENAVEEFADWLRSKMKSLSVKP